MLYGTTFVHLLLLVPIFQESTPSVAGVGESIGESPVWATLVGSTERTKYHRVQCRVARRIRARNAIWFRDASDAVENGYEAAACRGRDCQPPIPPQSLPLGELGGGLLPQPDLNPPEIVTAAAPGKKSAPVPGTKSNAQSVPPPRLPPARPVAALQVWQDVPLDRELDARRRWDVWAEWTLERWCERWHVSPSGKINSDAAYSPKSEQILMAKFKAMKEQIEDNRSRMKEIRALMAGKKKRE